jgi:hypothetical protein
MAGRRHASGGRLRALLTGLATALVVLLVLGVLALVGLRVTAPTVQEASGWDRAATAPQARGETAGAVLPHPGGDRLAVVGGLHGLGMTSDEVAFYDPADDAWTTGPGLPEPRHHTAAAGHDGRLWVAGGAASATDWTPRGEVWSLGPDGWETEAPLPMPRWGHRLVVADDRLHVVGGQPRPEVLVLDDGQWRTGGAMPEPLDHLGVVVVDDEIWTVGGRDENDRLTSRVSIYDPVGETWRDGPDLPRPISAAAIGVVDGRVHAVGGEDPAVTSGGVLDTHVWLDPVEGRWHGGPPSPLAVHGAAYGVVGDRLHVVGGAGRQGVLSVTSWTDEVQVLTSEAVSR